MARRRITNLSGPLGPLAIALLTLCGCAQLSRPVAKPAVPALVPATFPGAVPTQFASGAVPAEPVLPKPTEPTNAEPDSGTTKELPGRPSDASGAVLQPTAGREGPDVKVRGRIEADAISVNQSEKSKSIYGDFENAVGFRRARLGAEGSVGELVRWEAAFDFAGGDVAFKNMFVAVHRLPVLGEVRVGHFREPFSLEGQISSTVFPFIERSPVNVLDPARNWGVCVFSQTDDQRLVVQAGAFRSGTDITGTDIGDGNDTGLTARVTGLPWLDESGDAPRLLHVGAAASQRYAKNDTVAFRQGPQSSLLQSNTDNPLSPFIRNVIVAAGQSQLVNLQGALLLGPVLVQAEWTGTRIDQIGGRPVFFQGAYLLATYFLTGEHHTYDRAFAKIAGPRVLSPFVCTDQQVGTGAGPGAWELTARLGSLDLDDRDLPPDVNGFRVGGRLTTITLGVNWYLNDNARIMLNYVHAIPTDANFGSSTADSVTVRTAIFW